MKKTRNIEIGARVRLARKRMGLSREALAEMVGISTLFLGYIECGQKGMSIETLFSLSEILHVSCDYLLRGDEPSPADPGSAADVDETIYQLVQSTPPAFLPLLKEQIQLFLRTISSAKQNTEREAVADGSILLAARNGTGQRIQLSAQEAAALKELLAQKG